MPKNRLEAFSDGVLAIILTIMVLEFKVPHGADFAALQTLGPVALSYVLSFIYVGIYWSNHHHLLQAARGVNGRVLWANLHLLFWLSLVPFGTAWMGENHFSTLPVALYGAILLMAAIAYFLLARALVAHEGQNSELARAFGRDTKGMVSIVIYLVAVPACFMSRSVALGAYVLVALMWLVPDPRIERCAPGAERLDHSSTKTS